MTSESSVIGLRVCRAVVVRLNSVKQRKVRDFGNIIAGFDKKSEDGPSTGKDKEINE